MSYIITGIIIFFIHLGLRFMVLGALGSEHDDQFAVMKRVERVTMTMAIVWVIYGFIVTLKLFVMLAEKY